MLYEKTTSRIIKAFYKVYNQLGYGFLEKVYENSMAYQLEKGGCVVQQQAPIKVFYEDRLVGEYFADLLIDERVIVELKIADNISDQHIAQLVKLFKSD